MTNEEFKEAVKDFADSIEYVDDYRIAGPDENLDDDDLHAEVTFDFYGPGGEKFVGVSLDGDGELGIEQGEGWVPADAESLYAVLYFEEQHERDKDKAKIACQQARIAELGGTLGRVKASVERFCCIPHRKTKPHACTPMDVSDVESLRSLLSGVPEVLAVVEGYIMQSAPDTAIDGSKGFTVNHNRTNTLAKPVTVIVLAKQGTLTADDGDNTTTSTG